MSFSSLEEDTAYGGDTCKQGGGNSAPGTGRTSSSTTTRYRFRGTASSYRTRGSSFWQGCSSIRPISGGSGELPGDAGSSSGHGGTLGTGRRRRGAGRGTSSEAQGTIKGRDTSWKLPGSEASSEQPASPTAPGRDEAARGSEQEQKRVSEVAYRQPQAPKKVIDIGGRRVSQAVDVGFIKGGWGGVWGVGGGGGFGGGGGVGGGGADILAKPS